MRDENDKSRRKTMGMGRGGNLLPDYRGRYAPLLRNLRDIHPLQSGQEGDG